uniref:Uncharacterized protein n=1 Tax=Bactrocera latifrons TaxID=174628 RepID=A0A0K8UFE1_BACLA
MLALLKIGIVTFLVISCVLVTVTAEQLHNSRCKNNVCNCSFGTQEAVLGGVKYCLSHCPKNAVRLSFRICECRNGYQYINEQRTKCVRTNELVGDQEIDSVDEVADTSSSTAASTTSRITTNKAIIGDTNTTGNSYDYMTTTETISTSVASNTTNRGENLNVNSVGDIEDIYIWIGALLMALVLLVLLAFIFVSRK